MAKYDPEVLKGVTETLGWTNCGIQSTHHMTNT